ncbi:O-antigen ligase family protein [Acidithiobacillus sp.]|uniref:O-antigen ligase family protein n=1 Tax=Acidithiobacillus sp. TaxID=1872118 RepID=UPI00262AB04A|nr:O-antigen ligase family protein [Acidithiobacillus sp.]MDD5278459.1 O-antigen ligase family protein [Acidithiobacillus sp.]
MKSTYDKYYLFLILILFFLPLSIVAVEIFTGLFVLNFMIFGKYRDLDRDWLNISVLLIIFVHFLSVLIEGFPSNAIHSLLQSAWLLFIPITRTYYFSFLEASNLKKWFINGQIVNSCFGVAEALGFNVIDTYGQGHIGLVPFHIWSSMMLALGIIFIVLDLIDRKMYQSKIWPFLWLIFLLWELFSTSGRTGQAVMVIILAYILFVKVRRKEIFMIAGLILFVSLFAFSAFRSIWLSAYQQVVAMISSGEYLTSVGLRILYIKASIIMFINHPVFGIGIGSFRVEFYRLVSLKLIPYVPKYLAGVIGPTNMYFQYISELGLIGISVLLSFVYSLFKFILSSSYDLRMMKIVTVMWMMIGGLADVTFTTWCLIIPFCIFVSLSIDENYKLIRLGSNNKNL